MRLAALSRRFVSVLTCGGLAAVACTPPQQAAVQASDMPNKGLARLVGMQNATFAYEPQPACKLETETGDRLPESSWNPLPTNALAGKTLAVTGLHVHRRDDAGPIDWIALSLRDGSQTRWIRNVPTSDADAAAAAWRCVLEPEEATRLAPKLRAMRVRLAIATAGCAHFAPIVGGPEDVSIFPYDVGPSLLVANPDLSVADARDGKTGDTLGVKLGATQGDAALLVRADDFDRCFVPAEDVAPEAWAEARSVASWLDQPKPDAARAPAVSFAGLRLATEADIGRCEHDGDGPAEHFACVIPSLRVGAVAVGGKPEVEIVRERSLDAVHVYGGKLVPATDVVTEQVLVRPRVAPGLAAQLGPALDASVADAKKQSARAGVGYRLLRQSDLTPVIAPTHVVDVEVTYALPPPETVESTRKRKWVAGKKAVPNPELYRALRDYDRVRAELTDAVKTGGLAAEREKVLEHRLADAKTRVESTPKEIPADDERTYDWTGTLIRRKGAATLKATVRAPEGPAETTTTIEVPFLVEDYAEVDDPAHGKRAKPAHAPTPAEVDRAVAIAVVDRIDDVVEQWMHQTRVAMAGQPAIMRGSRAWAVAVAKHAASDRPVALLSDWLESRAGVLEQPLVTIPVQLPEGSEQRCFVFTAVSLARASDANLIFGVPPQQGSKRFVELGRDARPDADAGIELCGVPPGAYAVGVWTAAHDDAPAAGFVASVFESTPGAVRDDDVRTATSGTPRSPFGDEKPALTVPAKR